MKEILVFLLRILKGKNYRKNLDSLLLEGIRRADELKDYNQNYQILILF